MADNIREIALDSLIEILENDKFSHVVMGETLKKYQYIDKKNRSFYSKCVQGTIEQLIYIDYVINLFSKTKVKKMKPLIRNLIRLSVYQIKFMDSVPDSAACNEAVKLANKRGFRGLSGFVNGVLRNIARNIDEVTLPDETKDYENYLCVKYSMPLWIVTMWLREYGNDITVSMLKSFQKNHQVTIRSLVKSDEREELIESLKKDNVTVNAGKYVKEALIISDFDHISSLNAFKEGKIYIQDESSMLVAHVAGIKKDDFIVDVCAAPGGKSLHAAQLLAGTGQVQARDLTPYKVDLINENIKRCAYTNIEAKEWDALVPDESLFQKADIVIADLPCSGLGVIGQKSDIRYKTNEEDIEELSKLQRDILTIVKDYVKPGGTLIYSTCTVNDKENIENAKWLSEDEDFSFESLDEYIPDILINDETKKGYLRLFPGIYDCDGFFIARLKRKG